MSPVVHLRKLLVEPPAAAREVAGMGIRRWRAAEDVAAWLALRDRSFRRLRPAPRSWTPADFHREMTGKPWWRDEWTWIAVDRNAAERAVGAVTLALRVAAEGGEPATRSMAVVHWLLVDPDWRRRGAGRLLMSHLERAAWEAGWREVGVETHTNWQEAIAFYRSMGYTAGEAANARRTGV